MRTKTANLKRPAISDSLPAKNGRASNGSPPKALDGKKSINEAWIEKYGIDDSESAKSLLRAWNKTYENRNKQTD